MKKYFSYMVTLLLLFGVSNCWFASQSKNKNKNKTGLAALAFLVGNRSNARTTDATATFTLGGSVSGLGSDKTLVLTNGGVDKSITANGDYTFDSAVNSGSSYEVTVKTQPTDQTCTVSNGSGTASANVSNINVSCNCGTETYDWGTFTDQCNGTIQFAGTAGTFGGEIYTAQTLIFMKCSQGQTWNSVTNSCDGSVLTYNYCAIADNSCNGTDTDTLDGSGTSQAYTTCNDLNFASKTDWKVPTKNELKTLIHCSDRTMPNDGGDCGMSNFTSPAVNILFPNTSANFYWSSSSSGSGSAWSGIHPKFTTPVFSKIWSLLLL